MRRLKRVIARVLTACLIATSNVPVAFAEELTSETTEIQTEEATETEEIPFTIEEDVTSEQLESENVGLVNEALQIQLNYVVVESDYVETPDTQYVLADMLTEGRIPASATLIYVNQTTGETFENASDTISGTSVLFNLSFEDDSCTGVYKLIGIKCNCDGQDTYLDLDSIGASTVFGVNMLADSEPTAWIVDEDTDVDETGVTVTDVSSGDSIDGYDIAAAIAEISEGDGSLLQSSNDGSLVVVLDAGHSGSDCGTLNTINGVTYYERDINLKIANYCKLELEKYNGVTVYMTRTDNTTEWSIIGRVSRAAELGADVLVSIHINSGSSTATGALVLIPNTNYRSDISSEADGLGKEILTKLSELGLYNRGTVIRTFNDGEAENSSQENYPDGSKADYYGICRYSKRSGFPGIIIEHAFLSNPAEAEKYLTSDTMLEKLGVADATAIAEYYGLSKGESNTSDSTAAYFTTYNGVNYSAVYNYEYYIENNPDVKAAYGTNKRSVLMHFVNNGMKEGRQGCESFNVYSYKNRYSDLRNAFGSDLTKYYLHYINNGKNEGRIATGNIATQDYVTTYNGVDYSAVYDYNYYLENNADIKAAYGGDENATLKHFVICGMREGRRASAAFDVKSYKNAYSDLRQAYGNDLTKYYIHYINFGKKEGRKATGVTSLQNAVTIYNGVNYSAVYDYNYYLKNNADIKAAYGGDENATLKHFVTYGMREGRRASAAFDVKSYKNAYSDLRQIYGNDLVQYYMHYINYGKKEGRKATGVSTLQNPTTIYNGTDYSAVYDYDYYLAKNADIKAAFDGDENAVIKHFVTFGMKEGRQAKKTFNVHYYKNKYSDLQGSFGNNLVLYYMHYMKYGISENRQGADGVDPSTVEDTSLYSIMGTSSINVTQMVAYYNANATYPSFYSSSDAPTINDFCKIYIEECAAEGVKAEVAFAQAMKETGFLRYGGDVKIEQYNFAGLGASGGGAAGESFTNVRMGIRAQVQHLKAYASTEALNNGCVDTRFNYVTRGCAKYVEWLGINENPNKKGWASAANYGYSLRNDYITKLLSY